VGDVTQRIWRSGPRRVKRTAWGYTLPVEGTQERKFNSAWTQEDAQKALAARILEQDVPKAPAAPASLSFGEAITRYLQAKSRKKSLKDDERHLTAFKASFGADTPLSEITAPGSARGRPSASARPAPGRRSRTRQRPSTARSRRSGICSSSRDEWEVLPAVPRIRMEREPEGRIRWLEPDDEARLLKACRSARSGQLANIVTVALESGLRRGSCSGSPGTVWT